MLESLKRGWKDFKRGTPGTRFQEQYRRHHGSGEGSWKKWLYIGGGVALLAAGLFFLPAPGPGTVILFLGAALLAQGSFTAARVLDSLELRGRRFLGWARGVWMRSSSPVKALLVLTAAALAGAAAYGAYQLLFAK